MFKKTTNLVTRGFPYSKQHISVLVSQITTQYVLSLCKHYTVKRQQTHKFGQKQELIHNLRVKFQHSLHFFLKN